MKIRKAPSHQPWHWLECVGLFMAVAIGAALMFFLVSTAQAADCPMERQEARITEAIVPGQDTVLIFTGDGLQTIFSGLQSLGLLIGVIPGQFDKLYVIPYKYVDHLFFVNRGCIVDARDVLKDKVEGIMP